jgi:hypothetical protein
MGYGSRDNSEQKETPMSNLYDVLVSLSPAHDDEMLEGYRRYDSLLATILTPAQMETYAESVRQSGEIRIFEELTPDELAALPPEERAIALAIKADENISMENRRVVALLNQRGQHAVAPDLGVHETQNA